MLSVFLAGVLSGKYPGFLFDKDHMSNTDYFTIVKLVKFTASATGCLNRQKRCSLTTLFFVFSLTGV